MKKKSIKLLFLFALLFTVSFSASAQIYVKIRPTFRVVARPVQPTPQHVWVDEDWTPNGRNYRYSGGHWEAPRNGYNRRQGHWQQTRRGQVWIQGGWDRQRGRNRGHNRGGRD